jgi:hypothetical protein
MQRGLLRHIKGVTVNTGKGDLWNGRRNEIHSSSEWDQAKNEKQRLDQVQFTYFYVCAAS